MSKLVSVKTNYGTTVLISEIVANQVRCAIKNVPICKEIKEVWVFGSGVEGRCEVGLDLCIVCDCKITDLYKKSEYKRFRHLVSDFYDVWDERYQDIGFIHTNDLIEDAKNILVFNEVIRSNTCIYRRVL